MARRTDTTVTDPVLSAARDAAQTELRAAAAKFEAAAAWAEAHPAPVVADVVNADGIVEMYGDQPVTLAGEGAPGMSEFAVAEFAAAIAVSTYSGRALIGAALECKHRLPKTWARVVAGEVPVWKVRRVTEHTHRLTQAGAAHVDRHLAPVLEKCSFAQIERAVETASAEVDDEKTELDRLDAAAAEYVEVNLRDAPLNSGRVAIRGLVDYPTALVFERFLQATSHTLLTEFPELGLDSRRALALSRISDSGHGGEGLRELVIYTHHTPGESHGIVGVEGLGHTTVEQLEAWCRAIATKVTIRPVLDLDTEITADSYTPTPVQREQAILTTPTCVFPHCGRSARSCDLDHIVPWLPHRQGGETSSWNLAPLCRLHHRMKTHGRWTYTRLTRTSFEWTSPSNDVYLVDHTHTRRRAR